MKLKLDTFKQHYTTLREEWSKNLSKRMDRFHNDPVGQLAFGFDGLVGILAVLEVSDAIAARIEGMSIDGLFDLADAMSTLDSYILSGAVSHETSKGNIEGCWARALHESWGRARMFDEGPAMQAVRKARWEAEKEDREKRDRNSKWCIGNRAGTLWRKLDGKSTRYKERAGVWSYENRPPLADKQMYYRVEMAE